MSKELQAETEADNSKNADLLTSANLAQNPLLPAALSTEEANKIISEFDGWRFIKMVGEEKDLCLYKKFDNDGNCIHGGIYHKITYCNNWNSLMGVVEKIEALGVSVTIRSNFVSLRGWIANNPNTTTLYEWNGGCTDDSKILSTWYGLVEFVKWYNKQSVSKR